VRRVECFDSVVMISLSTRAALACCGMAVWLSSTAANCKATANTPGRSWALGRCSRPRPEGPPPADFIGGPVTQAVRAQLAGLPAAQERPGLVAIAIRLGQLMDTESAVPQYASAAKVLGDIIDTLSKHSTRRTRLSAVRSLTPRQSD